MSLIGPQRPTRQPQGAATLNDAHPFRANVKFALLGSVSPYRDLLGRHTLTRGASAAVSTSLAGVGPVHNAANTLAYKALSTAEVADFTGDITIIWHGVLLGNHGSANDRILSVLYGTGVGSPFAIADVFRPNNVQTQLTFGTNNGSYQSVTFTPPLDTRYGRPTTIVVSNAAGAAATVCCVHTPTVGTFLQTSNLGAASGNPRSSIANSELTLGGINANPSANPNTQTTGAIILNRAVSEQVARDLAVNFWSFFASGAGSLSPALLQAAAAPSGDATAIPAAGTSTVSAVGASNAATTATPAAGTSTVSAVGSTAPGAGSADAVVAAGTSTVSAVGASRAATSAVVAAGTSTVSAIGAARAAATATPAAGTSTVSAVGSTAVFIAAGDAVPASGTATVSAAGSATGTISTTPIPAAGVATVQGSTGVSVRLTKPQLKLRFADYVTPTAQDFSNLIDSYADYSATLTSWAGIGSGTGVLRVLSNVSVTVMPFASLAVSLTGAANTAQATAILGASTLGQIIFTAPTTSQALSSLGGGAVGQQVFAASTTSQFTSLLGPGLTAATQAEVSARTVTDKYAPPGNMNPHPGLAKAWCWMSVTAGVVTLRGAHNITEVSAIATGRYRFFMSSPMATSAYAVIATHSGEYTEENTNIGYGYAGNPRFKKPGNFDVFFGRPTTGPNTNPTAMNDGEFYVSAYGWV